MIHLQNYEELETLYGLSSNGKIKQWQVATGVHPESGVAFLITRHGYVDGVIQEKFKPIKGKNIGRSNETTPLEQAKSEALSDYKKKKDALYTEDMSSLINHQVFPLPMLAHEYSKRGHNIDFDDAWVQPKLNGVRCLSTKMDHDSIRHSSRGGKLFSTLSHISSAMLKRLKVANITDGEIFTSKLTFQEIVAILKKESEDRGRKQLQIHVYDMAIEKVPFTDRYFMLRDLFGKDQDDEEFPIRLVPTLRIRSESDLFTAHNSFVQQNYEGTMVRNGKGLYTFKHRSVDLQKYKDFLDDEFEIIGGKEVVGAQCTFRCRTKDNKEFDCRMKGTNESRQEQLINLDSYIGKFMTVKFQTYSDTGVPIFPVGVAIRDYE